MAVETGTATDYLDLLNKLRVFLTTNETLVAAGQNWTEMRWQNSNELILKGPGLAGQDEIYVGIKAFESVASDYYNWEMRGYVGYDAGFDFTAQPGASPATYIHLINTSIPYWFIANGQRFIVIAKVSTTYQSAYLGFHLRYGTPSQYPYPLIVAGTSSTSTYRWSTTNHNYRFIRDPGRYTMRAYYVDGSWWAFVNHYDSGVNETVEDDRNVFPRDMDYYRDNPDGSYTLIPCVLNMDTPANGVLGELDGVHYVSGFNNVSENIITINSVNYLVVQNVYRTGIDDYMAVELT